MREIVSPLSGIRSPFGQLTSPLAIYAVLGIKPQLVLDFDDEKYFANSARSTFSSSITHSASSNATMVDSDGLLKWRPHNLLTYSEQFDNEAWVKTGSGAAIAPTVTANFATAPDGTTTADRIQFDLNGGTTTSDISQVLQALTYTAANHTGSFWLRSNTGANQDIIIVIGNNQIAEVTVTPEWQVFSASFTTSAGSSSFGLRSRGTFTDQTVDILVWGAHHYRSDLGGMVNNPDRSDSYVPTTSSAVYLPRRGHHVYNGSAWVNEGVLHESEARANLVAHSIPDTNWSPIRASITENVSGVTAPDGSQTVSKGIESVDSGSHRVDFVVTLTDAATYTYSIFAKAAERSMIAMEIGQGSIGANYVRFNLSNGAVADTVGTISSTVEDFGDGWYRCSVTAAAGPTDRVLIGIWDGSTQSYTGDGTSGVYLWGAQLEAAPTPSSYIPTAGSTVTRAAETLTIPAAKLPYSATAMSIQMQGRMTYADDGAISARFVEWVKDSSNGIIQYLDTTSTAVGQAVFYQEASNVTDSVASASGAYTPGINVPFNIASRHGSTFVNGAVDGTALTANTTPTALPDLSATDLNLGYDYMGTIKLFRIWANDLADAGIAEATLPSLEPSLSLTFDGSENSFTVSDWSA